ncbi:Gap junction beta-5 protein, partial [Phaethon lepturus]
MNWGVFEGLLSGVNKYSTAFGRIWLSLVFIFRLLVYVVAAERGWSDDHRGNLPLHLPQPRQEAGGAVVDLPAQPCLQGRRGRGLPLHLLPLVQELHPAPGGEVRAAPLPQRGGLLHLTCHCIYPNPGKKRGGLWWTYLLSLVFKAGVDVVFLYIFYHLYRNYTLPRVVKCELPPCPNVVDCFISQPTEKNIFTLFMVVTTCVCVVLSLVEAAYLIGKR